MALSVEQFHELAERIESAGIAFILLPHLRFKGTHLAPPVDVIPDRDDRQVLERQEES